MCRIQGGREPEKERQSERYRSQRYYCNARIVCSEEDKRALTVTCECGILDLEHIDQVPHRVSCYRCKP